MCFSQFEESGITGWFHQRLAAGRLILPLMMNVSYSNSFQIKAVNGWGARRAVLPQHLAKNGPEGGRQARREAGEKRINVAYGTERQFVIAANEISGALDDSG
jgi:hypothetical protein